MPIIINDFVQAGITVAAIAQLHYVPTWSNYTYVPDLEMDTE
ncbi:MAG TPA: hypothetical protein VFV58_10055 [Blastocatellia bacterium]|nr:hypothetical protein [Blastocatellia bacterium]